MSNLFERRTEPITANNGQIFHHDLYCAECGCLAYLKARSWAQDIDRRYVFCEKCGEKYRIETPFELPVGTVIKDKLNTVILAYDYGSDYQANYEKDCYFERKGRYIKIKGKRYFLNQT